MTDAASKPGTSREATDKSVEPKASTQASREALVSLYVRGSDNDAKALYSASPGANDGGWQALERMLSPVKQFIADGGTPYIQPQVTTEYAGIPTPPETDVPDAETTHKQTRAQAASSGTEHPDEKSHKGNLSADVEAEKRDRGEGSKDANPGDKPGGGMSVQQHLDKEAHEKATEASGGKHGSSSEGTEPAHQRS